MPRADWKVLSRYPVVMPDEPLVRQFSASVEVTAWAASALATENRTLAAARELLLPRLVSGKIEVDSLGVDDVFGWAELASESEMVVSS